MTDPVVEAVALNALEAGRWDWETSRLTWSALRYGHRTVFDPVPAYPHDLDVASATLAAVADAVPPLWDVTLYLADREDVCRSNGHAELTADRGDGDTDDRKFHGAIVLSGKRVMPHPAMTRYLVGHEYGHQVQYMIDHARGESQPQSDAVLREYAPLRGLPDIHYGSAGRWHDSAGEVFACDFRLLVCDIEPEFWPHPGVERPGAAVRDWWSKALDDLAAFRTAPTDARKEAA